MNEIKVTVAYEKPTTSKFDALMAEYEAAKKYADETVAYYKPLADVAEEAKMIAILEQIEPIKQYAKQLAQMYQCGNASIKALNFGRILHQEFVVCYSHTGGYKITWGGTIFDCNRLRTHPREFTRDDYNILGGWDEWKMYKKLEDDATRQLRKLIDKQTSRANDEKNRLHNITKGGN